VGDSLGVGLPEAVHAQGLVDRLQRPARKHEGDAASGVISQHQGLRFGQQALTYHFLPLVARHGSARDAHVEEVDRREHVARRDEAVELDLGILR